MKFAKIAMASAVLAVFSAPAFADPPLNSADLNNTLMALSGTAGFANSQPIQRAWRDIHFASTHVSLNPEINYGHFGRTEFGLPRDPKRPFF